MSDYTTDTGKHNGEKAGFVLEGGKVIAILKNGEDAETYKKMLEQQLQPQAEQQEGE